MGIDQYQGIPLQSLIKHVGWALPTNPQDLLVGSAHPTKMALPNEEKYLMGWTCRNSATSNSFINIKRPTESPPTGLTRIAENEFGTHLVNWRATRFRMLDC